MPRKLVKLSPVTFKTALKDLYGVNKIGACNCYIDNYGEVYRRTGTERVFIGYLQGSKLDAYLREHLFRKGKLNHHYNYLKHMRVTKVCEQLNESGYNAQFIYDESVNRYHYYFITIYHHGDHISYGDRCLNRFLQNLLIVEKLIASFSDIKTYLDQIQNNFNFDRASYTKLFGESKFDYTPYFTREL